VARGHGGGAAGRAAAEVSEQEGGPMERPKTVVCLLRGSKNPEIGDIVRFAHSMADLDAGKLSGTARIFSIVRGEYLIECEIDELPAGVTSEDIVAV
jgi:hypothetical protein